MSLNSVQNVPLFTHQVPVNLELKQIVLVLRRGGRRFEQN